MESHLKLRIQFLKSKIKYILYNVIKRVKSVTKDSIFKNVNELVLIYLFYYFDVNQSGILLYNLV